MKCASVVSAGHRKEITLVAYHITPCIGGWFDLVLGIKPCIKPRKQIISLEVLFEVLRNIELCSVPQQKE